MTPAEILQHCEKRADGHSRYLHAQPAGWVYSRHKEVQAEDRTLLPVYCGFGGVRAIVVKTTADQNGINLFLVYADGKRERRNVNPRMNLFECWSTDFDLAHSGVGR